MPTLKRILTHMLSDTQVSKILVFHRWSSSSSAEWRPWLRGGMANRRASFGIHNPQYHTQLLVY